MSGIHGKRASSAATPKETQWVPEYGRDYKIKLIQQQGLLEEDAPTRRCAAPSGPLRTSRSSRANSSVVEDEAAATGSPLVIADTDALATRPLGAPLPRPRLSRGARRWCRCSPPRPLWLLADYRDVPFTQDGIRDGEQYAPT